MADELTEEQIDAENAQLREDVMAEVWGDEPQEAISPEVPEPEPTKEQTPAPAVDPVAELRAELHNIIAAFNTQEVRLKQAESRVGSMQNEMYAAKQAAKSMDNAPSSKELANASDSDAAWNELKEEYPEWAALTDAIDKKLSAVSGRKGSSEDVENRIAMLQQEFASRLEREKQERRIEVEASKLEIRHPGWEDTAKTAEYQAFIAQAPPEVQQLTHSILAKDASRVLDLFNEHTKRQTTKSSAEIAAERRRRLSTAQVAPTRGARPPTSMDDLSKEELWEITAKEVWAK